MARPLRIDIPGGVYHVTSRGNGGQPVFEDDVDRSSFFELLLQSVRRFHWEIHAYCLMRNHYHLLVETAEGNLSRGMRHINGVHTQRFNRRRGKAGHVFQGRFKAIFVEKESHLLDLCRYVVLNPVRAGMVKGPDKYRWSSYRATGGIDPVPEFLATDWVLGMFGVYRKPAQRKYRDFVLAALEEDGRTPWEELQGQILLGTEEFVSRFRRVLGENERIEEIPKRERYLARPGLDGLFRKGRGDREDTSYEAYTRYGYTQKEIARHLGVHHTSVSRWIRARE